MWLLKVAEVTTEHKKLPKISKNSIKSLGLGQSPPLSGLYLLVIIICCCLKQTRSCGADLTPHVTHELIQFIFFEVEKYIWIIGPYLKTRWEMSLYLEIISAPTGGSAIFLLTILRLYHDFSYFTKF